METLEDDPKVPRTGYISDEAVGDAQGASIISLTFVGAVSAAGAMAAAGGAIVGTILAAAMLGGAAGPIGSTLGKMVAQHHADHLSAQLEKGDLLLWMRTLDRHHEARAEGILRKHGGRDVHIHELPSSIVRRVIEKA